MEGTSSIVGPAWRERGCREQAERLAAGELGLHGPGVDAVSGIAASLQDRRVIVCAGPGGVGKTTVSAAVALGLAARGARVAVVTIDPARRLAEALGLESLENEPRPVDPARFAAAGLPLRGELQAMMLDVTRTFDELIDRLAPDAAARDRIIANPVYAHLSRAVAGSQEYTAMAKLFELHRDGGFEAIVLDTPPSRNAIDFLQAPGRLTDFLDDRAFGLLLAPPRGLMRAAGGLLAALRSVTGVGLFAELTAFFGALSGLLGGFRERAEEVERLLRDPATAFLVVSSGERAAVEEALFFAAELTRSGMHRSGVVLNRSHPVHAGERAQTEERLTPLLGARLAAKVAAVDEDVQILARRDAAAARRLEAELDEPEIVCVAEREHDLADLHGLIELQRDLFDG